MRISLISDLHLEYNSKHLLSDIKTLLPKADILVCAGDISNPFEYSYRRFLQKAKEIYKKVIVIPGNHEYYDISEAIALSYPKSMEESERQMRKVCEEVGAIFLQKEVLDIDNTRFFGCTLWANPFESGGEEEWKDRYDYKHISELETPEDYTNLHLDHKNWLKKELSQETSKNKVVITHHVPSYKLVDSRYEGCSRNGYYVSNCDDLMTKAGIWLAGHTHRYISEDIEGTRIFCNPIGYPWEESPYKPTVIEI